MLGEARNATLGAGGAGGSLTRGEVLPCARSGERRDVSTTCPEHAPQVVDCTERVGRAMLLERIEGAAAVLDDEVRRVYARAVPTSAHLGQSRAISPDLGCSQVRFAESALGLCRFVNNAGVVATELGVAADIGEGGRARGRRPR